MGREDPVIVWFSQFSFGKTVNVWNRRYRTKAVPTHFQESFKTTSCNDKLNINLKQHKHQRILQCFDIPLPSVKLARKGFVFGFSCRFSQNTCYTLECLPYDINSTCAEKPWPWRIQRWVKLHFPTLCGRYSGFWSRWMAQSLESRPIMRFKTLDHPATSKAAMSAPKCRKMKFDPPLDAPGSRLSSARRINIERQILECITSILWKSEQKSKNEPSHSQFDRS